MTYTERNYNLIALECSCVKKKIYHIVQKGVDENLQIIVPTYKHRTGQICFRSYGKRSKFSKDDFLQIFYNLQSHQILYKWAVT